MDARSETGVMRAGSGRSPSRRPSAVDSPVVEEMTVADDWFEHCLRERGHYPGEHEPDLSGEGISKAPDYLPTNAAGGQAGFEVKGFGRNSKLGQQFAAQRSGVFNGKRLTAPTRNQLGAAAAQLKGLAGKMPLVIVVANPESAPVDMTVGGVIEAMYGPARSLGPDRAGLGRDGKFTASHQYVSAVVILRCRQRRDDVLDELLAEAKAQPSWEQLGSAERADVLADVLRANDQDFPDGEYFHVDVIDTVSATTPEGPALVLPDSWFANPLDTRWRYDGRDGFEQVQGPTKPTRV